MAIVVCVDLGRGDVDGGYVQAAVSIDLEGDDFRWESKIDASAWCYSIQKASGWTFEMIIVPGIVIFISRRDVTK